MSGLSGVHIINKWLWGYLQQTDMFGGDYSGLIPIIPSHQTPEVVGIPTGLPFLVYNYKTNTSPTDYWMMEETATYVARDYDEGRLRATREYILNLTKRLDESAADLNRFNDGANGIYFNYLRANALSIDPPDQEGGRLGVMFTIRYEFTQQPDNPFS